MKSLIGLLSCVLADASTWCGACTHLDLKTIEARVEKEGLSFLTISLPNFCKDFERCLDKGFVDSKDFFGFGRCKSQSIPRLFSGMTSLIFDSGSGALLAEPSIDAIRFVRQACLMFKKILLPCSEERERRAYVEFVKCEHEVQSFSSSIRDDLFDRFGTIADILWSNVLSSIELQLAEGPLVPRHGPGATAERIVANDKFNLRSWPERLSKIFPADLYAIPSWNFLDKLEDLDFIEPEAETPVRIVSVPKTLKTPRIIGIEPVAMQYCQQAVLEVLVPCLEKDKTLASSLGFTDQRPNQNMALASSKTQESATLDLSEASDRVPVTLVSRMLRSVPLTREAVLCSRSTRADVPGLGVISLSKFASMGSALCFPVEAMVFLTIVISGITRGLTRPVSLRMINSIAKRVRIYGDDIIIPVEYAPAVKDELSYFNMKVNPAKSFWTGKFRESCGMDAYDGHPVTPVYVRHLPPTSRKSTSEIVSWTSLANQLYEAGMWRSSEHVRGILRRFAYFPVVPKESPILGFHTVSNRYEYRRLNPNTQAPEIRGFVLRETRRKSPLNDHGALMKWFLKRGAMPFFDKDHLTYSGRPVSFALKHRWATPVSWGVTHTSFAND